MCLERHLNFFNEVSVHKNLQQSSAKTVNFVPLGDWIYITEMRYYKKELSRFLLLYQHHYSNEKSNKRIREKHEEIITFCREIDIVDKRVWKISGEFNFVDVEK